MVRFLKFIAYMLFFLSMFLIFLPKENLFYQVEKEAIKYDVYISKESIGEKLFGLKLHHASISYQGIQSATIEEADFFLGLFYNEVVLKNIELSSLVKNYWPQKISLCKFHYSVLDPLIIYGKAKGLFGKIDMHYNLQKRTIDIFLKPSKLMLKKYSSTLRYFKKLDNGEYRYEKTL